MIVLGIETSCDECAIALVKDGREILGHKIASQIQWHKRFGGVVPEVASRLHQHWIDRVLQEVLSQGTIPLRAVDVIAATAYPGLIGSLVVGWNFARGLAVALGKPLVAINHLHAHIYSAHLDQDIVYPYGALVLSGGHSFFALVRDYDSIQPIGQSQDDACGEVFDKVAHFFHLGFPGGKVIEQWASKGNLQAYRFPMPVLKSKHPYHFSYSGLKTAVIHQRKQFWLLPSTEEKLEDILCCFQEAAFALVLHPLRRFLQDYHISRLVVGGGVLANSVLRKKLRKLPVELYMPSTLLSTDNAAMVAGLAFQYARNGRYASIKTRSSPFIPSSH